MTEPVKIFITSCLHMWRAELALEYSILKYAKSPVEINFIRAGDPGWRTNADEGIPHKIAAQTRPDLWNTGRDHARSFSSEGWATPFTCLRFAIPELCNFKGRAIHFDVDFLVLKDLRPIFEMDMPTPLVGPGHVRTDFMLIDCEAFGDKKWWPRIAQMRPSGWQIEQHYKALLRKKGFCTNAPGHWESWDGKDFLWHNSQAKQSQGADTASGKSFAESDFYAVHFTNMHTQPWKPLPGNFEYPPHDHPQAAYIWWEHYAEAIEKWGLGLFKPQTRIPKELYADVGSPLGQAVDIEAKRAQLSNNYLEFSQYDDQPKPKPQAQLPHKNAQLADQSKKKADIPWVDVQVPQVDVPIVK